ncbi:Fur family transcriptional regulator [Paeniglutamicibacter psychrophenolicus]|uniref:Fur family ferric uptake transcriptional regulator n=1 Tax=Paeniglutamicibacter psychrophenolicus TaxID=257454 RepID=A0ABS4WCR4_9MICC|nr:Fur family transcriptional regulator [Paeniglutamicibacter psychrophenolicus]MBP2373923.1 Fur family ferric uptake transcriptional regulator [Paeniglutamicibacter psychrophenolicus]
MDHMDYSAQMRDLGLRVTRGRLAVLEVLDEHPHSSAEKVVDAVHHALPDVSIQSVYNVLNDLTEQGMLRRFSPPHSPALYETRVNDNHHHAICTSCGRIEDVECAVGHAPCLTPSDSHGMVIQIADVLYQGICEDCRKTGAA